MTTLPSGCEGERKLQPMRSVAEEDHRRGVTVRRKKTVYKTSARTGISQSDRRVRVFGWDWGEL